MSDKNYRDTLPAGYGLHWFELKSVLGRGGYGVTYLALDKNLDRQVAIKEYLPIDFATRHGDQTVAARGREQEKMYQWGLERFLKEARTLAKFNHPNIVRVISVFEHNGTAYMVMEYEQGEDLSTVFKRQAFFSEEELLDIFIPVIDGLSLVHQSGFIHRDIKPSNIYIRDDKSPVLIDFGSARQSSGQTRTLTSLVTYGYAPFEQYNEGNEKQGPWTDIYSLGATIYFGITKKKPEDAMRRGGCILAKTPDPYKPVSILAKNKYSENFLLSIDNAMRFRAEDRPQDAITWAQMLLGNIKAPALPVELITEPPENSDKTMMMPQYAHDKPDTSGPSKPNTGRMIDASGRRVTSGEAEKPVEHVSAADTTPPVAKKSGKGIAIAIMAALSVLLVVLVLMIVVPEKQHDQSQQAKQVKTETKKLEPEKPVEPEPPQQASSEIDSLLKQAEQDVAAGRLVKPEGNNAAFHYLKILKKDPGNKQAREGINKIVRHYGDEAKHYLDRGDLRNAESQLAIIQSVAPQSPVVLEVRQQVQAVKDKNTTIVKLLKEAEQDFKARRLTEPETDNALVKYNNVLKIDPANQDAKQGINHIFTYYVDAATSQLSAGNVEKFEDVLAKMDLIKPASPEARALRKRAKSISAGNARLNKMLDLAYSAYKAGRYIKPASKSAFHYYSQALKLDRGNASAEQGIKNIRDYYKRNFEKYLAQNDLVKAEQFANALKVVEDDAGVVAKAFQDLQNKKVPPRPEVEIISEMVGDFKKMIEARNVKKIKSISEFSPGREQFVNQFYDNYQSVNVSVSGFQFISKEHKGKASIQLDKLINKKGQSVRAGAWGKFDIVVKRNQNNQWRVFW